MKLYGIIKQGKVQKGLSSENMIRSFFYAKSNLSSFNRQSKPVVNPKRYKYTDENGRSYDVNGQGNRYYLDEGQTCDDVWTYIHEKQFQQINSQAKESLGYPTQKPLAILERIIKASSNPGDIVLDPFCGCGTTIHAAESLGRQWIGVDISRFSIGLINERIMSNFKGVLDQTDIDISGQPETVLDARRLAEQDRFEFEKWACGKIGAHGMAARVGEPGADGGIDGIIEFWAIQNSKPKKYTAIVQVKSGHVTPDSVRGVRHRCST